MAYKEWYKGREMAQTFWYLKGKWADGEIFEFVSNNRRAAGTVHAALLADPRVRKAKLYRQRRVYKEMGE